MKTLFLLAPFLAAAALAQDAAEERPAAPRVAAVVVNASDFAVLGPALETYARDAERARPGLKIRFVNDRDFKAPAEIREALKALHAKEGLEGALLVGDLPLMRFRTKDFPDLYDEKDGNVAVLGLYFEDLDAEFRDPDGDRIIEDAPRDKDGRRRGEGGFSPGPAAGPEIWVSFVPPDTKDRRRGLERIQGFFAKVRRARTGESPRNGRVLLWQCLDKDPANVDVRELKKVYPLDRIDHYGLEPVDRRSPGQDPWFRRTDLEKIFPLTEKNAKTPGFKYHKVESLVRQLRSVQAQPYDLYEVHYGGGYFHAFLLTEDVRRLRESPRIVALNACRTGQFDFAPEKSIALAYLYDTGGTVSVMGPAFEANWSQIYNIVYRGLAEGKELGPAWLAKERTASLTADDVFGDGGRETVADHDHTRPEHAATLLGDPFARLGE